MGANEFNAVGNPGVDYNPFQAGEGGGGVVGGSKNTADRGMLQKPEYVGITLRTGLPRKKTLKGLNLSQCFDVLF